MRNRKLQGFAEFIPLLQRGLLVKKSPPLPAEAARVGMASLLPTHIPRVVFFYGSPCIFLSGPVVSVMFKYILRVNVGGCCLAYRFSVCVARLAFKTARVLAQVLLA